MSRFYYIIPIILVLLQGVYTFSSNSQLRWEEMEMLRDNYWFANHLIWLRGHVNFGGYATVDIINSLFGFHIYNFNYFKLFLALISLLCAAALLKRFLGTKAAIIALLTFGLSPTLLFFNSMQTVYGLDLQYFPILLYLVLTRLKNYYMELLKIALLWMLMMWGWLSYPVVAFYLPVILIFFLLNLKGLKKLQKLQQIFVSVVAFLIPLIFSILWIDNKEMLFGDVNLHGGLFLAGAQPNIEEGLGDTFYDALSALTVNLFYKATAYHFEVNQVEFSLIFSIFSLIFIVVLAILGIRKVKEIRLPVLLAFGIIFFNVILSSIAVWSNIGFRRYTPILMAVYSLLAIVFYLIYSKNLELKLPKQLVGLILSLLLLHHIIVYPINLIHLKDPSPFRMTDEKSIREITDNLIKGDVHLDDGDVNMYAAVMSSCFWNRLPCHKMFGFSEIEKREVEFTIEYFSELAKKEELESRN